MSKLEKLSSALTLTIKRTIARIAVEAHRHRLIVVRSFRRGDGIVVLNFLLSNR
jgi:hypothetical protein